jgi:hypothetical protein
MDGLVLNFAQGGFPAGLDEGVVLRRLGATVLS